MQNADFRFTERDFCRRTITLIQLLTQQDTTIPRTFNRAAIAFEFSIIFTSGGSARPLFRAPGPFTRTPIAAKYGRLMRSLAYEWDYYRKVELELIQRYGPIRFHFSPSRIRSRSPIGPRLRGVSASRLGCRRVVHMSQQK